MFGTTIKENCGFTENNDKTFSTSGDLCLDFFTRITRNAALEDYVTAFVKAWNENRKTATQIILNMRDVRNGKGEKLIPCVIMVYLKHKLEHDVYEAILRCMVNNGCWKDLLRIYEIDCRSSSAFPRYCAFPKYYPELQFIAKQLSEDELALSQNNKAAISLCAKWAPSENTHYDHHPINAATEIRKLLNMSAKQYRLMLTKLRNHLNILEMLMSTQKYDQIDFSKLPSVAHMKMRKAFCRDTNSEGIESDSRKKLHESYADYLSKLKKGETKVNVKGIQPHELVSTYLKYSGTHTSRKLFETELDPLVEEQWKALLEKTMRSGAFRDVTAIVDVSGSMEGQPLEVAMALGILVADCTKGPYHGQIISFHEKPTWHKITGVTLQDKVQSIDDTPRGGSTDLRAVFNMILDNAKSADLAPEEMVKTLFVFTDMQFNKCDDGNWESTFEYARRVYQEAGYELPRIICWNLRTSASKTLPVEQNEKGFAMLSGFSAELLKCVLTAQDITPYGMMLHVLEPYDVPQQVLDCGTVLNVDPNFCTHLKKAIEDSAIKKSFKPDAKISTTGVTKGLRISSRHRPWAQALSSNSSSSDSSL